jgi:hypothetical protein
MSDTRTPQHESPTPMGDFVTLLSAIAVAGVMLLIIGSADNLGSLEANAAPVAMSAPGQY